MAITRISGNTSCEILPLDCFIALYSLNHNVVWE
jgi:hypothetical protein